MAGITCPYCGVVAFFTLVHNWDATTARGNNLGYGVWRCQACEEPIVGLRQTDPVQGFVPVPGEFYPQHVPKLAHGPEVPASVAADAIEAKRCFAIGAWRASAAMARRALQAAAFEKGAPDKPLIGQIDWLEDQRLITPLMKEVAHKIRLGGNLGAHPDKDGLQDVDEPEATRIMQFLDDFIRYVYEIPGRLSAIGDQGPTT